MLVLVVEDNRQLGTNIVEFLESEGFECDYSDRGDQAAFLAAEQHYDMIVLDVMLPGLDGLSVCKHLRNEGIVVPILMLTARDTLDDKLQGFEVGADDYLVKPFALPELSARLRALAKRQVHQGDFLQVGELSADVGARVVRRGGKEFELNPTCWTLLIALMRASPAVVSREQLEANVWGDHVPDSDALRSHLYQLRKIIDKPFAKPLIHTVRHIGVAIRP
ncbi:MAG TPA: two-component system response regulator [Spongiibacteraceae bacterium]|nr:two-component system response regulator [Spongiibacteraceae bacterium]HCS26305.1 two-component system response regulator [Spongiibacteraceae bacterium]|tara:strand:+ start:1187 stop:1849 length:663 start_codon:yes stop_codon:yes gene_type:complete